MKTDSLLNTVLTVLIAVLGWLIAHYFSSKRDRRIKAREIITSHLIKAYTTLANDINERGSSPESNAKLELLIAEIQLFGSEKQIALAIDLAYNIRKGGSFNFDELLNNIRNELRKELELKPVKDRVTWLRFVKDKKEIR